MQVDDFLLAYQSDRFVAFVFDHSNYRDKHRMLAQNQLQSVFLGSAAVNDNQLRERPFGVVKPAGEHFFEGAGVVCTIKIFDFEFVL